MVRSDGLENQLQTDQIKRGGPEAFCIEVVRPEVINHNPSGVEQRFDIDQGKRPPTIRKKFLALLEVMELGFGRRLSGHVI